MARPDATRVNIQFAVIVVVLGATAVPVELRPSLDLSPHVIIQASDMLSNIVGYIPIGIALGGLGRGRAIVAAAAISAFAEAAQTAMMHRDPSIIDVFTNTLGAIIGLLIRTRLGIRSTEITLNRWTGVVAAVLALVLLGWVWSGSGPALNAHGYTTEGTLEAHWKLDDGGRAAADVSAHHLDGTFENSATRRPGVIDGAVQFNGSTDDIFIGQHTALRLLGSVTISAWINSSSYPADDAAIVSTFNDLAGHANGYQLDTTVDTGTRTVGFKLANVCAEIMARYGATPLQPKTWYHVAGVYDAQAQTVDVYLNGKRDNGMLRGSVMGPLRSSRKPLYIGRRPGLKGFEFAGALDDVRIYSRALAEADIATIMRGQDVRSAAAPRTLTNGEATHLRDQYRGQCGWCSEFQDGRLPGAVATCGVLIALASLGLFPSVPPALYASASFVIGFLWIRVTSPLLPSLVDWVFPLTSLAGTLSVIASRTGDKTRQNR